MDLHALVALDKESRLQTLLAFAEHLTVTAREGYLPGEEPNPRLLRGINEAMHQVLQHTRHVTLARPGEYPEDGLAEVLGELASQAGIGSQLEWAWARALKQVATGPANNKMQRTSHG
jgi:hypothetical protein